MDTDETRGNHYGTPIAYAAKEKTGKDAVQYLLARGADPTVMDCWGQKNAISWAKLFGSKDVVRILLESIDASLVSPVSTPRFQKQSPRLSQICVTEY